MINQKTKILKRELAELLGCLPIVVSGLVKKGEVKVGIDRKIDISSQEMKEYIKNKRIEIQRHKERIRKKDYTPNGELKIKNEKLKINNILKNNDSIQGTVYHFFKLTLSIIAAVFYSIFYQ